MSFIYNMADTWNAIGTTFQSILMNISNGAGGPAVGAATSRPLSLQNNNTPFFEVDISGNIYTANANMLTFGGNVTTAGAFSTSGVHALILTLSADTNVTLPTSGTLVNTGVTSLSSLATVGTISTGTWAGTTIAVNHGGTGDTTLTTHGVLVGAGTSAITQLAAAALGTVLTGQSATSDPSFSATPQLGVVSITTGQLALANSASANLTTIQSGNATSAWTFTLPTTSGSNNQVLATDGSGNSSWVAQSGGSSAITIGTTSIASGTTTRFLYDAATVVGETAFISYNSANGTTTYNLGTLNGTLNTPTTDAILLTNTTAAIVTQNQFSPTLHFIGQGWKTTATAGSQQFEFQLFSQARNSTNTPSAQLVILPVVNGVTGNGLAFAASGQVAGALENNVTYLTGLDGAGSTNNAYGVEGGPGSAIGPVNSSNAWGLFANACIMTVANAGIATANGKVISLSSATVPNGVGDTILSRSAAATLQLGNADVTTGAPIAQTLRMQGITATSNAAGANFTLYCSPGTGTGIGGSAIIKVAPPGASGSTQNSAINGLSVVSPQSANMQASTVLAAASLSTTDTDGFLYIASGAGTPTGTPTTQTGRVPMYIDSTNSQLWLYLGGAWKQPKTPAGAATVTWQ